jgi:hypothetical protein
MMIPSLMAETSTTLDKLSAGSRRSNNYCVCKGENTMNRYVIALGIPVLYILWQLPYLTAWVVAQWGPHL